MGPLGIGLVVIVIFVAAKLKFAPETAKEAMQATLLSAERYIKADGLAHSYHAEIAAGRCRAVDVRRHHNV